MGVSNFILGGIRGYSAGNDSRALKKPPANCQRMVIPTFAYGKHTAIIFAVVVEHEDNLPLEDVIVDQAAADSRDIFVGLHLLQLPAEQDGSR